jgi:hypothetical protein
MNMEHWWNDNWQGKIEMLKEKSSPIPFCPSQTNSTWTVPILNPGLHDENPTNCLNCYMGLEGVY